MSAWQGVRLPDRVSPAAKDRHRSPRVPGSLEGRFGSPRQCLSIPAPDPRRRRHRPRSHLAHNQPLGSHSPARASAHIPWASSSDLGAWAARTHSQSAGTARSKSGGYLHQRTGRARKHQHVPTLLELPCGWSFASVIACWCMVRFMYQRRHTTGLPATATSANVSLMSPTYRLTALHEGDVEGTARRTWRA